MALPANVNTGFVKGTFLDFAGNAITGTVTFSPAPSLVLDAGSTPPVTMLPQPVVVNLVDGAFVQELVATDDTDLNPSGWTYSVSFKLKAGAANVTVPSFPIAVPQGLVGAAVDLALVAPITSSGGVLITRGVGVPPTDGVTPGWVVTLDDDGTTIIWAAPPAGTGGGSVASTDITDSTAVGRAVLVAVDAAAARSALGLAAVAATGVYGDLTGVPSLQPLDADLTAIAAIATTTYGRNLLALAAQVDLMALLSAATTTAQGIVELATNTETTTGTDAVRATTPAGVKAAIDAAVANLINSAPGTLDTLGEIATALHADESTASALATTVAGKLAKASNLADVANAATALANLGGVPSTRTVAGKALSANITLALADLTAPAADFSMNTHKITNVVDPTGLQDAATKNYVDNGLADKLDSANLLSEALTQFTALMVPVAYASGWPALPSGLTTNADVGFHFIGGPSTDPPPAVSGPAVWDATS
jgi:hypothetical protein